MAVTEQRLDELGTEVQRLRERVARLEAARTAKPAVVRNAEPEAVHQGAARAGGDDGDGPPAEGRWGAPSETGPARQGGRGYETSASSRPASRSRPRCTAAVNFWRLTSSVLRISSA